MKLLYAVMLVAILSGCGSNSAPVGGHNGITFDMNQENVEKLGFVCKESKPDDWFSLSCSHMAMTGRALNHSTAEYRVTINRQDGKVCQIDATFTDIAKLSDYMLISSKVTDFYSTKVHSNVIGSQYDTMWIDKNKARLVLYYSGGAPPILPDNIAVSFWSPNRPWKD